MANKLFNATTVIAIVGGLSAGIMLADYLREPTETPEIAKLGEAPAITAPGQMPEFTLPDLYDEPHSISEWYGRPLIINFWATWCAPCRREMPLLQIAHETAAATDPMVIGVAVDRTDDVRSYVAESGYTYQMLIGQQDALDITELFGFEFLGLPFTVFTTASGAILKIHVGELHAEQFSKYMSIYKLLNRKEISEDQAKEKMAEI